MVELIASFQGAKRAAAADDAAQASGASASQRLAGRKEVQAAVGVQFGVKQGIPAFLEKYGWEFGERAAQAEGLAASQPGRPCAWHAQPGRVALWDGA